MSVFDEVINRRGTDSIKWNDGSSAELQMWIADMDFAAPTQIINAIEQRAQHGVYGYTEDYDELNRLIIQYYKIQHQTTVKPEWIVWLPNVNVPVNLACRMTAGNLLMATPIYSHIYGHLPNEAGKQRVAVPLHEENGFYSFDFEAMQEVIKENNVDTFILCNPHNPVGRCYRKEELEDLLDFAEENHLFIVSDEIHSDLVWGKQAKHVPFFSLGERAHKRSITLHAASKTYNLAGIPMGFAIIPDEQLRAKYNKICNGLFPSNSVFAIAAYKEAFSSCENWRQELLEYLRENDRYLGERIKQIKGLHVNVSESTYLGWIDTRETGIENPFEFFIEKANVRFADGATFGAPGFVRINYGCPRSVLKQALDQVESALANK